MIDEKAGGAAPAIEGKAADLLCGFSFTHRRDKISCIMIYFRL